MIETVIAKYIQQQRPYYNLTEKVKGIENQYWLIFKHRDADNLLHNIISFIGFGNKQSTYKLLRIDINEAIVYEYIPKREGNLPSNTLLRTSRVSVIANFLELINAQKEETLLAGSFLEIKLQRRRKFTLPNDLDKYRAFLSAYLEKTKLYRRCTAFFNSGILKLYSEPLESLVRNEGEIRLLMDWQGFTDQRDVKELEKLYDPTYREQYIKRSLQTFLSKLEENTFNSTQLLAELVRLEILKIKMVKMEPNRAIYHKKTGILSDHLGNHIEHDGSDNFTLAAHSKNAESITFLYWNDKLDGEAIEEAIATFDQEWFTSSEVFDLSHEFLNQILLEKERRFKATQPIIKTVTPHEWRAGESVIVKITGHNLQDITALSIPENDLITFTLSKNTQNQLDIQVTIALDHPSQTITHLTLVTNKQTYSIGLPIPIEISQPLQIPDYPEIEGYREAIAQILEGKQGTPEDFIYSLAMQRRHLWEVKPSNLLDEYIEQGLLFEHQKSGAQHCYRILQDFGVAVCADAVGLGKTRLAAAVARLTREEKGQVKIAIIAARKLHDNWNREMETLGFKDNEYELYNKNLMSRKGAFVDNFNRYGGPDLVIIDEAHEGIRNYNNRIHKTCLDIRNQDRANNRERFYLLLTATPWNNRREDIYNLLSPFLSKPDGFKNLNFPSEVPQWFENRETGLENFTDNTLIFRRTYRELFLQRTRKMLIDATPDLNLYAKRIAEWLPVEFEPTTEQALEEIFTQFEDSLYIPSADPIRYLTGSVERRSLLNNQRRMFLQRAESSMYALRLTIRNFSSRIELVKERLSNVEQDIDGLRQFLLIHYGFESSKAKEQPELINYGEEWEEEDDNDEPEADSSEQRQQLISAIDNATDALSTEPTKVQEIFQTLFDHCDRDLERLAQIAKLLETEFVKDHKREQVKNKVKELVTQGQKVLLISVFSDTVIDYYRYLSKDPVIADAGIGMAIGSEKRYYCDDHQTVKYANSNFYLKDREIGVKRLELFRRFAPDATCRTSEDYPNQDEQISVLIGSETLSVGQNLQDANYLICIDLPYNPMVLEQRIGRIDRPKKIPVEYITIYYANSQSQLLRQATRLNHLHKKLIGELAQPELATTGGSINPIATLDPLGASIYGDTLFDDEVLPGYVNFIHSLVNVRSFEQEHLQEQFLTQRETNRDLITQHEILHCEEVAKLIERMGKNYQPNPMAVGLSDGSEPTLLATLTVNYFGPNGEPITDQQTTLYWNDLTGEQDSYGLAIATGFKTPQMNQTLPASTVVELSNTLYKKLLFLKQSYQEELEMPETTENVAVTSQRISLLQKRLVTITELPQGIDKVIIRATLSKLGQHREMKAVQKLLKDFTDGDSSQLEDADFLLKLVNDTAVLSLLDYQTIKATSLSFKLNSLLVRI
ncbi:helicase-related protein [Chroococcus sp. FPU101]|uniref:helicase-related protein n=1 Tax=Chroococcus sp. FPU101 TaxID=1974212 RepID=UPI001A8F4CD2|nr:helicase-related protein [Chroococcus sp. FPU101]GFE72124.1 hypothetical protein CFPU101_47340 [Chroococcus sp. FPU101]